MHDMEFLNSTLLPVNLAFFSYMLWCITWSTLL